MLLVSVKGVHDIVKIQYNPVVPTCILTCVSKDMSRGCRVPRQLLCVMSVEQKGYILRSVEYKYRGNVWPGPSSTSAIEHPHLTSDLTHGLRN